MVAGTGQSKPNTGSHWTLASILDNPDAFESEMQQNGDGDEAAEAERDEDVEEETGAEEGYCVECEGELKNPFVFVLDTLWSLANTMERPTLEHPL
jgi:hypothetical protein